VNGIYVGMGTIPAIAPGYTESCGINLIFNKEGTYKIKAEIVGPNLNEFFDINNDKESTLIAVDPVTLMGEPDFGSGTDTFVSYYDSKLAFGETYNLKIGRVSTVGGYGSGIGVSRSYLKFDTSGMPENALILDAELKMYMYKSYGGNLEISTHQVLEPWSENGLTYSSQPNINTTVMSSLVVDSTTGYKSWDITSAVQAWTASPSTNFGLMMISKSESTYRWKEFYSSDSENGLRPQIIVYFAMLENKPDITTTKLSTMDYQDSVLRLYWNPVPYSCYYEIYRADTETGPFIKLGTTWDSITNNDDGSLDTFFYDDIDGGYPEPPTVITTDRGGLPGTIRVMWESPGSPDGSPVYYYRIKAIGEENRNSILNDSPTKSGQVTPEIMKYILYSSTSYWGPWNSSLVETEKLYYSHSGLGPGKLMYYRLKSISSEDYISTLSKTVWGRTNRPPTISNLYINPTNAYTNNYLEAKYTFSDLDGDYEEGSQIRWYCDGSLVSAYNDKTAINPTSTKKDQIWYFTVNPKDDIEFGTIATSGMNTILNSQPKLSKLEIKPVTPVTTDALNLSYSFYDADGDTENGNTICWYKNGVHITKFDGIKSIPSTDTTKGDVWNATIRVNDGTDKSIWYQFPAVTILNSVPVVNNVMITPAEPKTGDALNAVYTYFDADSDLESGTEINWYKFDNLQTAFNNKLIVPSTATMKGDVWHFTIKPNDGEGFGAEVISPAIKIDNSPPSVSDLKLYPVDPKTKDTLYIEYTFNDPDSDRELDTMIKWYCNGDHMDELDNELQVQPNYTNRGETWKYSITPMDGFIYGDTVISPEVVIINTAPEVTSAIINPLKPAVKDDLTAEYFASDADLDPIENIQIKWYKDSVEQIELADEELIPASYTASGETWQYTIKATDGFEFGAEFESEPVTVNFVPEASELMILPKEPTSADELHAIYVWSDEDVEDTESESIVQWYKNSILIDELTNSVIVPVDMTTKGDEWYFSITPCDGKDYGFTVKAKSILIENSVPRVTKPTIVRSSEQGDLIYIASYIYSDPDFDPEQDSRILWYKNNDLIEDLTNSKGIPMEYLLKDDVWYFTIKPYDGEDYGDLIKSSVLLIENVAPVIERAVIAPDAPITTEDLVAELYYYDPDNDDLDDFQPEYSWYMNDQLQPELNSWSSVPAKLTARGETWYYKVRLYDGYEWSPTYTSTPVTVQNSVPQVSDIELKPERPLRTSTIRLEYTFIDIDGDRESVTHIRWYRDNVLVEELNDKKMVSPEFLNIGDDWYCTIQANDGIEYGDIVTSGSIRVNIVPTVTDLKINPNNPSENDKLELSYEYIDSDLDPEGVTIINWFKNGEHQIDLNGQTVISAKELKMDDEWYATVQPNDGFEYGTEFRSNTITIVVTDEQISESEESVYDHSTMIGIIVIVILIIILLLLFISRKKEKETQEEEPLVVETNGSELILEPEKQYEYEYHRVSEPAIQRTQEPTKTRRLHKITKSKPIPLTNVIQSLPKQSKSKKVKVDLKHEPVEEYLPYDQIDIEFKCPRCDSDIASDADFCTECGEEFGSIS
jgi:hypothetical protein